MKTKKKEDPRKLPEHAPKPAGQWVAELMKHIDTSAFNNLTITSFDTAKLRNDELQRELYETVFILGKAEEVEQAVNTSRKGKAILMGGIWRDRGVALFKEGKPNDAIEAWKQSIRYSLSEPQGSPLPHPTAFIQEMADTGLDEYSDLMACANDIAQAYIEQERFLEALDWLNECMCLHRSSGTANEPASLAWFTVIYPYEEFNILYIQMMMRWEIVFWKLGNTSAAHAAIYDANCQRAIFRDSDVLKAAIQGSAQKYTEMRHPDPRNIEGMRLISPDLQIRGAWRKLRVTSTPTTLLTPRAGPSTAVYNGLLYVFGGEHYDTSSLKDGWALNLKDLNGWRPVAGPPPGTPPICQQSLIVYEGKGYLFQGQNVLRVFDFKTETWHEVITRLRTGDPWRKLIPKNYLIAFTAHLYKGKIYVFGGRQEWGECGRNVMMSLDIKTLLWDVWSGTPEVKGDVTVPGPRAHACSWIVDDKFYLSLGSAKRKELGTGWDHMYVDLWSFDLLAHKWVEEKFTGNTPCFRTQSAHTFNDAWNKALIFGGYNARMPWSRPDADSFAMGAYFADTYAWCAENKRWLQVITKSFPTYRCGAEMFTDQSSGRTYLFGGGVATSYAPSRKPTLFKLFGDLWELVIDSPKSSFNESDFESADPRFSQLGPWVRCYHCGSVGRWMSCSGSCRRTSPAASFCGKECQRLAWPEHKRSCRKI